MTNKNLSGYTVEQKAAELRKLVFEASVEQRADHRQPGSPYEIHTRIPNAPWFDGRGFQDDNLNALIDALTQTDALFILDGILNGEYGG